MERNDQLMWLQEFKIALVEEDTDKLTDLSTQELQFETVAEMEEAMVLIQQAEKLFKRFKDETAVAMKLMKKNIDFVRSTQAPLDNKLDITS